MNDTPSGRSIAIEKTTIKTLSTLRTGSGLTMVPASGSDEADADLEKFLHLGQVDFLDPPADAAAGISIPVHHGLERLGRSAAQAVYPGNMAAAHVGEQ